MDIVCVPKETLRYGKKLKIVSPVHTERIAQRCVKSKSNLFDFRER